MQGVPSAAEFKHEPLPDSTTHIRLLEIQGIDAHDHIVCLLTAWPVEQAPDYYALSYTWGSPYDSHEIFINGRIFMAGRNCVYALRQAHSSKASRYFWMDALCIDQSTTQEKSHQVGMMSQIYARSVHVLACVGPRRTEVIEYRASYKADGTYYWPYKDDVAYPPYQDDSTLLFRFIDRHRLLLASIHRLTLRPGFEQSRNWVEPNPIPKSSWIALRCLCAFSPRLRQTVATKFFTFMKRPYFSRVWVLQELHLAPNISLCCGTDVRSFDYLLAVSMLVDFWINISDYGKSLSFTVSFTEKLFSWQPWFWRRQESCATDTFKENLRAIQNQRDCLSLASGTGGRRRLAVVLDVMHSFNCTDARDRLFGVLALVDWGRGKTVIPDYEKDSYQLAVEVLQLYLENPRTRPVSGMAIEWSRQLWEIFGVDIQGQAIQNAKLKRYNGDPIPYHDSPLLIEFDPPHISESFRGVNGRLVNNQASLIAIKLAHQAG